jgi:hypothetical protein
MNQTFQWPVIATMHPRLQSVDEKFYQITQSNLLLYDIMIVFMLDKFACDLCCALELAYGAK